MVFMKIQKENLNCIMNVCIYMFFYMVIVTGSGPEKVIFIHGFRGSITDFEYFVKRLVSSPKYECCTYYLRGVGYR